MSEIRISPNDTFDPSSLPRCLCHFSREDALSDARALALFLQNVLCREEELTSVEESKITIGALLCFDLLLDKIEIGMGEYRFPLRGDFAKEQCCLRRELV